MKVFKYSLIVSLILIALIVILAVRDSNKGSQNARKSIETKFSEIGYDTSKIISINKNSSYKNVVRYAVDYDNELYYVLMYDNFDIISITNKMAPMTDEDYIYRNDNAVGVDISALNNNIQLVYGQLGDYGKEDIFGDEKFIRYYIPAGKYVVKALTKDAQFFIEGIEIYKNEYGYDESEMVRNITIKEKNGTEEIEINENQCILLTVYSSIELEKQ